MAYLPILDSEIDAESPITESLMTRLRDNALAFAQLSFTVLTGSGNYSVPAEVTKLRVIMVSGGGGGGGGGDIGAGGGGGGGKVEEYFYTTTGGATIAYACGAGGGSAAQGGNTTFGTLTCTGGHAGGGNSTYNYIYGAGGNTGTQSFGGSLDGSYAVPIRGAGNSGGKYCGGHGGHGGVYSPGTNYYINPSAGGADLPVSGTGGTASGLGDFGGGGGAPMALPFYINGCEAYLGAGGSGGSSAAGGNATLYGAGGGGGSVSVAGGNGSAGIIFVLPIG